MMQIRMNANIQREWQINLGQGYALMQVSSRAASAEVPQQHRNIEICTDEVPPSHLGQCSVSIFLSISQNDQVFKFGGKKKIPLALFTDHIQSLYKQKCCFSFLTSQIVFFFFLLNQRQLSTRELPPLPLRHQVHSYVGGQNLMDAVFSISMSDRVLITALLLLLS